MAGDYDVAAAVKKIEDEVIASMIRNLDHHRAEEDKEGINWEQWQVKQLAALEEYKKRNAEKYGIVFDDINARIESLIRMQRAAGHAEQEIAILKALQKGAKLKKVSRRQAEINARFFLANDRKINALIQATKADLQRAEYAILRMANDKYRKIIFDAQMYAASGAGTYENAVDMATKDFLRAGINCVEYSNGARHTASDYADMAIRTAGKRAYLTGEGESRRERGISTVIMNKRGNACSKCLPFVGKVLIDDVWSGGSSRDGPYPLMSTAIAAGLYHPRCKDIHSTYFPGISTPPDDVFTKKEKKETDRQNAKRQAESCDRLAKYSLDKNNKKIYAARASEWKEKISGKIRGFLANNFLSDIINIKGDTLKMNLQFFSESDIKNQESASLIRAIRKYEKRIEEHKAYINDPVSYIPEWGVYDVRYQEGLKRHWEKEIRNFQQSIEDRIAELKERGDYNE